MGRAYSFFYCNADKDRILEEMPDVLCKAQLPADIKLGFAYTHTMGVALGITRMIIPLPGETLEDASASLDGLVAATRAAEDANLPYVFDAAASGRANREMADHLSVLMNSLYSSPLYVPGEEFRAEIVYREGDAYVCLE
jgi:hypothetical protein